MKPTKAIRQKAMQLLAADEDTLAHADGMLVALVKGPFNPSELLAIGDLELADFDGSTPKVTGDGTQPEALDANSGDSLVDILPPAEGWRFETTGTTNLPQTVYGFVLTNAAGTVLIASETFETPITLEAVNQRVVLPQPTLRQRAESIS